MSVSGHGNAPEPGNPAEFGTCHERIRVRAALGKVRN